MCKKRSLLLIIYSVVTLFAGGEWFARAQLGLGTPPLYISDELTEYRLKPGQDIHRFGNRIAINEFSMRSAPLARIRDRSLQRVLIFGDSVLWGGSVLDQNLIATNLLQKSGNLEVGNVAAPSWGPGNWLGWTQRYGFLEADTVVLVISSHDAADNPSSETFLGNRNHPLHPPASALWEGFNRYFLPRLEALLPSPKQADLDSRYAAPTSANDLRVQRSLGDLRTLITRARASGARVLAVQFADREEAASGTLKPGNRWISELLQSRDVPAVQAGPIFRNCGPISSLYIDGIHPYTASGQACLAQTIEQALALPLH